MTSQQTSDNGKTKQVESKQSSSNQSRPLLPTNTVTTTVQQKPPLQRRVMTQKEFEQRMKEESDELDRNEGFESDY